MVLRIAGSMLFVGGMLAACIMDWKEQKVYRFIWLLAGTGAGIFMVLHILQEQIKMQSMAELLFYLVLQQLWFGRFYGRADCHAFCVSAMWMWGLGLGLYDYVMHMLFVFMGLTLVQLIRRNIGRNGQLKKPVALIPYIAAALWVWVDFADGKWYIY